MFGDERPLLMRIEKIENANGTTRLTHLFTFPSRYKNFVNLNLYKEGSRQGRHRVEQSCVPDISLQTVSFLLRIMKLYVPNPQKWLDFFERVSTGQTQLSQRGRGRQPHVITVDQSKQPPIKAVLLAEQTATQAKSGLERKGINLNDIVKAFQSSTGRGRKRKATTKVRVGIKPRFYHKAQPGWIYEGGFWGGGVYGFDVGFINLKVYH